VLVNGGVDFSKKPIWIEGPHLIRHKGFVYLICAEGGTAEQHSQVVLRAISPEGPFTPYAGNPILTQRDLPRDRNLPVTSAGHADFVETPSGQWWATFLAVRPYNAEDMYNTGREVFLMPVDWSGDWPRITSPGEVIPYVHARPDLSAEPAPPTPMAGAFTVRDEFDGQRLAPSWMMMRNPRQRWYDLASNPGALTLAARPVQLGDNANPSFLGRRQQHLNAEASTLMHWRPAKDGDRAGLAAVQNDDFWFEIAVGQEKGRRVVELIRRAGSDDPRDGVVIASARLEASAETPVRLRITAREGLYDFDYSETATGWTRLAGDIDGTILSTRKAGGFVGVTLGPFAISGAIAVDPIRRQ
jgi:alpha-N-arabinofuranosidase